MPDYEYLSCSECKDIVEHMWIHKNIYKCINGHITKFRRSQAGAQRRRERMDVPSKLEVERLGNAEKHWRNNPYKVK